MRFKITPFRFLMFEAILFIIFSGWWVLFFVLFALVGAIAILGDSFATRILN